MAAAYEATATLTDDESFAFVLAVRNGDEDLDFSEFEFEYRVDGCDGFVLKSGDGIEPGEDNSGNPVLLFEAAADRRLRPGRYSHGLRATHIESGKTIQFFDGTLIVSEGNFR